MIPVAFSLLRPLHEIAVKELRILHIPCGELERASEPGHVMLEATRAQGMILAARSVALKLPGDAYARALDLTAPAAMALDDLHAAAMNEFLCDTKRAG